MKWHPYAKLFPMMGEAEIEAMAEDIRANGQRLPCLKSRDDLLIDGRNRSAACALAGVEPKFETFDGDDAAILKLVLSLNLPRRHLTESQRAMVAADLANLPRGAGGHTGNRENAEGNPKGPIGTPSATVSEAAEKLKVGKRSVKRARKVKEKATPEVSQAVRDGKVSVTKAAQIADKPIEEQPAALAEAIEKPKAAPLPDGEDIRLKILDRLAPIEKAIRMLCDTDAGANVDRAKAVELLGKLVAAVKGQKRRVTVKPATEAEEQAERLWNAYPRRENKGQAIKAIIKAMVSTPFPELLAAVEEYANAKRGEDPQFIPHPATWFNARKWEDDRSTWRIKKTNGPRDKLAGLKAATRPRAEPAGYLPNGGDDEPLTF